MTWRNVLVAAAGFLGLAFSTASCGEGGCESINVVIDIPPAVAQGTTVQVTIGGVVYELACPSQQGPVAGGGLGYCGPSMVVIYFADKTPSEITGTHVTATDGAGNIIFSEAVTFNHADMPDPDGMPGICDVRQ